MEQLIAQQRKHIENKESEVHRLQRLNASLSEQVNDNIIYNNNKISCRIYSPSSSSTHLLRKLVSAQCTLMGSAYVSLNPVARWTLFVPLFARVVS